MKGLEGAARDTGIDDRSHGMRRQVGESVWLTGGKRELGSRKYKTGRSEGKRESLEGLLYAEKASEDLRANKSEGGLPKRAILQKWKCSCRLIFFTQFNCQDAR